MSFDVHFWVGSGSSPYPKYSPDPENLYRTGTVYENEIIQKIYSISLKINMLLYHLLNFYIEKIVPVFLFFLHIVV